MHPKIQSLLKTAFYRLGFSIKRLRAPRAFGGMASPVTKDPASILPMLHRVNPYEGFDFSAYPADAQGWGSESPVFRELIGAHQPRLIIEAGTWKGGSALHMAGILQELGIPGVVLCIDTWLGALEFWTDLNDPERYLSLKLHHGYPSVYYQFLANVCRLGLQDRIVPFPQTSSIGALWLRAHGIRAEMIYIDGSHEEEDVYEDVCGYWEALAEGGVLFGDDYDWDGVRLAVDRFAGEQRLQAEFRHGKWLFRKGPGKDGQAFSAPKACRQQ